MKLRALLVIAAVAACSLSLVACSGGDANDVKVEKTTGDKLKESGENLRKPAAPGSDQVGNSAKPTPD